MNDKLTIQELVAYLPYGVKFMPTHFNIEKKSDTLYYLTTIHNSDEFGVNGYTSKYIKPILYPLSSLTKEIEHKGEKFVPIEKLFDINLGTEWSKTQYIESGYTDTEWWVCLKEKPSWYFGYNIENGFYHIDINGFHKYLKKTNILYQKLAEWHIDFQNLIPQGKAIDKTTIQ